MSPYGEVLKHGCFPRRHPSYYFIDTEYCKENLEEYIERMKTHLLKMAMGLRGTWRAVGGESTNCSRHLLRPITYSSEWDCSQGFRTSILQTVSMELIGSNLFSRLLENHRLRQRLGSNVKKDEHNEVLTCHD